MWIKKISLKKFRPYTNTKTKRKYKTLLFYDLETFSNQLTTTVYALGYIILLVEIPSHDPSKKSNNIQPKIHKTFVETTQIYTGQTCGEIHLDFQGKLSLIFSNLENFIIEVEERNLTEINDVTLIAHNAAKFDAPLILPFLLKEIPLNHSTHTLKTSEDESFLRGVFVGKSKQLILLQSSLNWNDTNKPQTNLNWTCSFKITNISLSALDESFGYEHLPYSHPDVYTYIITDNLIPLNDKTEIPHELINIILSQDENRLVLISHESVLAIGRNERFYPDLIKNVDFTKDLLPGADYLKEAGCFLDEEEEEENLFTEPTTIMAPFFTWETNEYEVDGVREEEEEGEEENLTPSKKDYKVSAKEMLIIKYTLLDLLTRHQDFEGLVISYLLNDLLLLANGILSFFTYIEKIIKQPHSTPTDINDATLMKRARGNTTRFLASRFPSDFDRLHSLDNDDDPNLSVNIRKTFYGGRTETFRHEPEDSPVFYFDIRGSYTKSIQWDLPISNSVRVLGDEETPSLEGESAALFINKIEGITETNWKGQKFFWFAKIEISLPPLPDKPSLLRLYPPIPTKDTLETWDTSETKVLFPVGEIKGWYSSIDLQTLLTFYPEEPKIKIYHPIYVFPADSSLKPYSLHNEKEKNENKGTPKGELAKLLNNRIFGKIGINIGETFVMSLRKDEKDNIIQQAKTQQELLKNDIKEANSEENETLREEILNTLNTKKYSISAFNISNKTKGDSWLVFFDFQHKTGYTEFWIKNKSFFNIPNPNRRRENTNVAIASAISAYGRIALIIVITYYTTCFDASGNICDTDSFVFTDPEAKLKTYINTIHNKGAPTWLSSLIPGKDWYSLTPTIISYNQRLINKLEIWEEGFFFAPKTYFLTPKQTNKPNPLKPKIKGISPSSSNIYRILDLDVANNILNSINNDNLSFVSKTRNKTKEFGINIKKITKTLSSKNPKRIYNKNKTSKPPFIHKKDEPKP